MGLMLGVKNYLEMAMHDDRIDDNEVLKSLPSSLQKSVLLEARMPTVEKHCMFSWLKDGNFPAFRDICHTAFRTVQALAGTVVFERGDAWETMIFVETGLFRYVKVGRASASGAIRSPFMLDDKPRPSLL